MSAKVAAGLTVVLFLTPLLVHPSLNSAFQLPQALGQRLGVGALLVFWLALSARSERLAASRRALTLPVLAFLGAAALAAVTSPDRFTSFFGSYRLWFGGFWSLFSFAAIYWIAANAPEHRRRFLGAMVLSSVVVAAYAVLQRLGFDPLWGASAGDGALSSTLGNKNYLGAFTAMAAPVCLYFCYEAPKRWMRAAAWAAACLNVLVCFLSVTRGAWIGLALGLGLWTVLTRLDRRRLRAASLLLGLGLLLAGILSFSSKEGRSPILDRAKVLLDPAEQSAAARLSLWRSSLRIIKDHPVLGVGLDAFGQVFPRYQEAVHRRRGGALLIATNAHNEILQIGATMGLIGLGAYLWFWAAAARLFRRRWQTAQTPSERALLASLAASGLALEVHAFFNFSVPATSGFLWCWLGVLDSYGEPTAAREIRAPSWARAGALALAALGFFFAARLAWRYAKADWHFRRGDRFQSLARWQPALAEYERSIAVMPRYYPSYMRAANAHLSLAQDRTALGPHLEAARELCLRANALFPGLAESPYNLGMVYYHMLKYLDLPAGEEGARFLKRAVEAAPMYPEFWVGYGKLLELSGKPDQAQDAWLRALQIVPYFKPAMQKLAPYLPKKEVRFLQYDLTLKNVSPGSSITISQAAGQVLKLISMEEGASPIRLEVVSLEQDSGLLPAGYSAAGPAFRLALDKSELVLEPNSVVLIDGALSTPRASLWAGKKVALGIMATFGDSKLPAGAHARLLIEMKEER